MHRMLARALPGTADRNCRLTPSSPGEATRSHARADNHKHTGPLAQSRIEDVASSLLGLGGRLAMYIRSVYT